MRRSRRRLWIGITVLAVLLASAARASVHQRMVRVMVQTGVNEGWWQRLDRRRRSGVIALAVAAFIAAGSAWSRYSELGDATTECHDAIEMRLVAPATAEYEDDVERDGDNFIVRGSVDAENSFAAPLRRNFACLVKPAPYGYYVSELSGLDQP